MTGAVDRAVVIGASVAGLLAARALTDTYSDVVVIDRDGLPFGPLARGGVPQSRHSHGLLARGREVIEELLPGITADLVEGGAASGDVQQSVRMYFGPRHLATGPSGILGLGISRAGLEWAIRQRVAALPGVTFRDRTSVLDLTFSDDDRAVTGVVTAQPGAPEREQTIDAALVVDASGRGSRTPERLARHGYPEPPAERHRVDVTYVTRRFRRPPARSYDGVEGPNPMRAMLLTASPEVPRSGVLLWQEDDAWTASIAGYHGRRPPTELPDFIAYARTLCSTDLADVLEGLEPLDDGTHYRFPANVRQHYERMPHLPAGLLVVGDALCAFDPSFGQGMTVAALEARDLRDCVRAGPRDLARRFFTLAAAHIDTPWQMVVGRVPPPRAPTDPVVRPPLDADAASPHDGRHHPASEPLVQRALQAYVRALVRGAVDDPVLARAFMRVSHLTDPPASLVSPALAIRVARQRISHRATHPADRRAASATHRPPDHPGLVDQQPLENRTGQPS